MNEVAHRRRSRQRAIQWLYAGELEGSWSEGTLERIRRHFPNLDHEESEGLQTREDWAFTSLLIDGLMEKRERVDELIRASSRRWRLDRMDVVSLCILRLGAFELAFMEDVPHPVVLAEAVALAERYGDGRAVAFVNGVLEQVRKSLNPQ